MGKIIKSGIEYAGGGGGGGDVDKQYVDAQDAATLQSAKSYTDGKTPTVVQTTGQSITDVMSQKAVTDMIFDNSNISIGDDKLGNSVSCVSIGRSGSSQENVDSGVRIGYDSYVSGTGGVAIGSGATSMEFGSGGGVAIGSHSHTINNNVVIGANAKTFNSPNNSVALGAGSFLVGGDDYVVSVGNDDNTITRKIIHVADGVDDHDAVTVGQLNTAIAGVTPPTVVQAVGRSTTDVMSQKAVTDMIFPKDSSGRVNKDIILIGQSSGVPELLSSGAVIIGSNSGVTASDIIVGSNNKSTYENQGMNSILGKNNIVEGQSNVAIGSLNKVNEGYPTRNRSIAIGYNTTVDGKESIAIGQTSGSTHTTVSGDLGIAIGAGAASSGGRSVAIGERASANAQASVAIGSPAKAGQAADISILGDSSEATGPSNITIGPNAKNKKSGGTVIGSSAENSYQSSVALGYLSKTTRDYEVNVRYTHPSNPSATRGRIIGGVANGTELDDAATVAQGNKLMTAAPTTTSEGVLGQLWTDTRTGQMHTYQCTAIDKTDPDNPVYTWTQRW